MSENYLQVKKKLIKWIPQFRLIYLNFLWFLQITVFEEKIQDCIRKTVGSISQQIFECEMESY